MHDVILLALMAIKENFDSYRTYIKASSITRETNTLLKDFEDWYHMYPQDTIDMTEFRTWFFTIKHPAMKEETAIVYRTYLDKIVLELACPSYLAKAVIEHYITMDIAVKIQHESHQYILGREDDLTKVTELVDELRTHGTIVDPRDKFVTTDIRELVAATVGSTGYEWRMNNLNQILGPIRKGDFIVLAARPETGKTTLLCSELTYIATQLEPDQMVLWVCNEESGNKIQLRIFQSALGKTKTEIVSNLTKAEKDVDDLLGKNKIRVYHEAYINYKDIDKLCQQINPGIIVFDQLDKIQGFKADRQDLIHQAQYQWAREKANEYGPVICVSQCDGTAEGQRFINMSQLAGSKTAKQGEADAMIMIGYDPTVPHSRFIHVPKNKLAGGPKSDESRRHGMAEVVMRADIVRYEG